MIRDSRRTAWMQDPPAQPWPDWVVAIVLTALIVGSLVALVVLGRP